MAQSINVKIVDKSYNFSVSSPEEEEVIRQAAASVSARYNGFVSKYPGQQPADILTFVALNEAIGRLTLKREVDGWKKASETLHRQTDSYLKNIEEESR